MTHTSAYQHTERFQVESSHDDDLRQYLHEIGQYRVLAQAEEQALAMRIECGDRGARETFINHNLRLVVPIAQYYAKHSRVAILDLIQEGNIGLMHAVEKFDHTKGYKFSTYATIWIKQRITRTLPTLARAIYIPVHMEEKIHALKKHIARCEVELGHEPSYSEIAALSEGAYTIAKITEMLQLEQGTASLDVEVYNGHSYMLNSSIESATLGDMIADTSQPAPEAMVEQSFLARSIVDALSCLNAKDRRVFIQRYGLDGNDVRTLEEIAQSLGVCRERIRQREVFAKAKMRPLLAKVLQER